nr:CalB-type lipase [synthetic construct]
MTVSSSAARRHAELAPRVTGCAINPTSTSVPTPCGTSDVAYDVPEKDLYDNIFCANGVDNISNPILLVPGIGAGGDTYTNGYQKLLTNLGYDVCYVSPPRYMLDDEQDNAQYVAYALNMIYSKTNAALPVLGYSGGNAAIQWALTFWPSTRTSAKQFIALAGPFQGTIIGKVYEAGQLDTTTGSIRQLTTGSKFLAALKSKGGDYNWVPTTSIYSHTDDVLQPEPGPNDPSAVSFVGGSRTGNVFIQQFCPGLPVLHSGFPFLNFSYQVTSLALSSSAKFVDPKDVPALNIPCNLDGATGLSTGDVAKVFASTVAAASRVADTVLYGRLSEPDLKSYVASYPDNAVHD